MDEHSVSSLNETGTVRLLSLLGNSLAAVCVLAAVGGGCTSPSATDPRDGIASGSFSAEPSAPSAPRFAAGGPDTEDYGASDGLSDRRPLNLLSNPVPRWLSQSSRPDLRRPVDSPRHYAVASRARKLRAGAPLRVWGRDPHARRLPGAQPGHRSPHRARRHDPHRALPVRPQRSASLHLVVDGQDRHLHAGRHRDRGRPHPLGG